MINSKKTLKSIIYNKIKLIPKKKRKIMKRQKLRNQKRILVNKKKRKIKKLIRIRMRIWIRGWKILKSKMRWQRI